MRWLEPRHLRIVNKVVLGGQAVVRDLGLAGAALEQTFLARYYDKLDVFHTAAVLAAKMMQAHAFVDGNKRMAWATAQIFLWINGLRCTADSGPRVQMVVGLANKSVSTSQFASFLQQHHLEVEPPR